MKQMPVLSFLVADAQASRAGAVAHLALQQVPHGEQAALKLRTRHGLQEIALVLVAVHALAQLERRTEFAATGVVAGGDGVEAQHGRVVEEQLELDLAVAQHVRIRRVSAPIVVEEAREDVVPVFGGEVGGVQANAEHVAHRLGVLVVDFGSAVLGAVVLFPVLHEQADHVEALFEQQQRAHGGIHAAGHPHHDPLRHALRLKAASERSYLGDARACPGDAAPMPW